MSDTVLAHAGALHDGWSVVVLAAGLPAGAYLAAVGQLRRRSRRWSRRRTASFTAGCGLLAVGWSPWVGGEAAASLAGHMVQHLLLGMFAPILLVLGAPVTVLLGAVAPAARATVRRALAGPAVRLTRHLLVVTALHTGGLYLLYLSPLYELSTRSDPVHVAVHAHVLVAGYLFAWAVAGPEPAPHRPALRWRMATVVLTGGAHAFLAKRLYAGAPDGPPGTSYDLADVEAAAQLMYYGGHLADAVLITAAFAAWYRRRPRTGMAPAKSHRGGQRAGLRGRPVVPAGPGAVTGPA